MCVLAAHIRWFSDKDVCFSYVYIKIDTLALYCSGSCVKKNDVYVSLTDVSVVFLTCLCVLAEHIRWFSDIDVCLSCVYI